VFNPNRGGNSAQQWSMRSGRIRVIVVIVVIVVHPRQVLLLPFGRSSSKSVQYVQKSSNSSTEVTVGCLTRGSPP
jgi:hypothetical protein